METQTQISNTKKADTHRMYVYTNKTNATWVNKNANAFGSRAKFLDALITEARKSGLTVTAPKTVIKKISAIKKVKSKKLQ